MTTQPEVLWHYTCDHSQKEIGDNGHLIPGAYGVVWLTDLPQPDRDALGLTRLLVACDRTRHRYRILTRENVFRYISVRRVIFPRMFIDGIESAPGAMPMHWWVATRPVLAVYDPWSWT